MMQKEYPGVPWTFTIGLLGVVLSWKQTIIKFGRRTQGLCLVLWRDVYNITDDTLSTGITLMATLPWIGQREFTWHKERPN